MNLREAIERDHTRQLMGDSERWIRIRIFRVWVPIFPLFMLSGTFRNFLRIHDANHLIHGYDTDFAGEVWKAKIDAPCCFVGQYRSTLTERSSPSKDVPVLKLP